MYLGIDVSNNNGQIDWPTVAQSAVSHVAIKATEGLDFDDLFYHRNIDGVTANGMVAAAYHFARPSESSGRHEAEKFLAFLAGPILPRRYFLDLEDDRVEMGADLGAYALDWLQTVREATGKTPGLYTSPWYAKNHKLDHEPRLGQFKLWLASWKVTIPSSIAPWRQWEGWQFTDEGVTPGIGRVDQSLWKVDWV